MEWEWNQLKVPSSQHLAYSWAVSALISTRFTLSTWKPHHCKSVAQFAKETWNFAAKNQFFGQIGDCRHNY